MTTPAARRAFSSLVAAACIDGKLNEPERLVLHRKAAELDIPIREFEDLIRQGLQKKLTVALPATTEEKHERFEELIDIVCADGRVESQEKQILLRFASYLGVDPGDLGRRVRDRLNRTRNESPPAARDRVDHPEPIRIPAGPRPRVPEPAPPAPAQSIPPRPHGPITLEPVTFGVTDELTPITRELVKNVIRFDGLEEAIAYVQKSCGVVDPQEARRIVDKLVASDPECRPASLRIRHGR